MKHRPEYDRKMIGENLRRCRQRKNLSVEQVREYLNLGSQQAIYKWEEGKSYPQADTMFALMELYEIELRDLLKPLEEKPPVEIGNIDLKLMACFPTGCTLESSAGLLTIEHVGTSARHEPYKQLLHYQGVIGCCS